MIVEVYYTYTLKILKDMNLNRGEITKFAMGLLVLKNECCGNHSWFQPTHKIPLSKLEDVANG